MHARKHALSPPPLSLSIYLSLSLSFSVSVSVSLAGSTEFLGELQGRLLRPPLAAPDDSDK